MIVVDASVVAKWFMKEPGAPQALALLGGARRLCAPSILRIETASAIVRAHRTGRFNRADAEAALASAAAMLLSAAVTLFDSDQLQARSEAIALDIKHPFVDCLYVALAEREGADLITADATLLARAQPQFPFIKAL